LVWEEKREDVVEMCKEKLPVLKEVKSKEMITDKEKPVNLLIEGDNYHALSVLNYTHAKKVDVIYIDPPYNTGNKDFIFNDRYVDREDAYRHSKWLSFIEKRLRLARNLLKDTGVIFISIDDNEVAQLKLLMDSPNLFGEKNYIGIFAWRKKVGAGADSKLIFQQHEYILWYARNKDKLNRFFEPLTKEQLKEYKNPDNDPRGLWAPTDLTAPSSDTDDSRLYEVISPTGKKWLRRWSYTKENMQKLIEQNLIWFGRNGNSLPKRKRFLKDKKGLTPRSWLDFVLTQDGKKDFEDIFGKENRLFQYPKPVKLMKHLLRITTNKNSLILDFMAGTGTTGQAVLELNKEDGGNRQFILVTNNENNICTDVCYPRIKKVVQGYKNLKGEQVKGLGGNLKYFKTDFVDAEPTDKNKIKLTKQATEMLCIKEGTFDLVQDRGSFKIFKNSKYYTGIIFDQSAIPEFKRVIKDIKGRFSVYIFSLGDEDFSEEFADLNKKRSKTKSRTERSSGARIKLSPIPEVILRVYRRIFK